MQEPLATLVVNKLRGNLKVIAVKAPGFGERKTSYLEDIAIMTGATLVKDELGTTLESATEEVFGTASKVTVGKESCTIVAGDTYEKEIQARVAQIKNMIEQTEQDYEREKLNERVARLSGGVAVIQARRTAPACETRASALSRALRQHSACCDGRRQCMRRCAHAFGTASGPGIAQQSRCCPVGRVGPRRSARGANESARGCRWARKPRRS